MSGRTQQLSRSTHKLGTLERELHETSEEVHGHPYQADGRFLPVRLSERRALILLGDVIAGALGSAVAYLVWEVVKQRHLFVGPLGLALFAGSWSVGLLLVDGYSAVVPRNRIYSVAAVGKAILPVTLIAVALFYVFPFRMNRPTLALSVLFGAGAVLLWRVTIARVLLNERLARPAIVVSSSPPDEDVMDALRAARSEYGVVASIVADEYPGEGEAVNSIRRNLALHPVASVLVGRVEHSLAAALVRDCIRLGVPMKRISALLENYLGRVPLSEVDANWFIDLPSDRLLDRPTQVFRRLLDLAVVVGISIPLMVLMPFLALAIRLDSPGPVFYRQRRVGQFGREFDVIKFRTMHTDAEAEGACWQPHGSDRATRVGRLLRIARIDEWPQVLNIWRGQMSLIGPRPERPEFVELLSGHIPHYSTRLMIRPGLTGWAQVKVGYTASIEESRRKLEYDLYYIKYRSIRLDLQVIFLTVFTILGMRGR